MKYHKDDKLILGVAITTLEQVVEDIDFHIEWAKKSAYNNDKNRGRLLGLYDQRLITLTRLEWCKVRLGLINKWGDLDEV